MFFIVVCIVTSSHYGGLCGGGAIRAGWFLRLRQPCTVHHLTDWRQRWWLILKPHEDVTMTTQLVPLFNGKICNETTLLCDARDLHAFLSVGKIFAAWIKDRIADYGLIENQDYVLLSNTGKQNSG